MGELLFVCDDVTWAKHTIFLKNPKYTKFRTFRPKIYTQLNNILNLGHFKSKNTLIASWCMKNEDFIAFSATTLQYFGEKLSLALTLSHFLISNPKNITIMHKVAHPKVYWTTFNKPKKCLTPRYLLIESPHGFRTLF